MHFLYIALIRHILFVKIDSWQITNLPFNKRGGGKCIDKNYRKE